MSNTLKLTLYVTLVILAGVSGYSAFKSFGRLMDKGERTSDLELIDREERPAAPPPAASEPPASTQSQTSGPTGADSTNTAALNEALSILTNSSSGADEAVQAAETNVAAAQPAVAEPEAAATPTALGTSSNEPAGGGRLGLSLGVFVISLVGIGLLAARDVSQFMGNRALDVLYNDDGEGLKNPEYEAAEKVWANGDHLEAIRMMRDYLNRNPREQYIAIRIAEIYEKDLGNYLAAALEYEEVLKHKLAPERWGWAAIHLCNLYFKLDQEAKAHALLRRIVSEYGTTAAAEKARKRLEKVEGENYQLPTQPEVPASATPAAPAQPASNLPPGFRPKK